MLSHILTALTVIATASAVVAIPVEQAKRGTEIAPTVQVCSGAVGASGCISIPVVSDACINFIGGHTFLNKEVSAVVVPGGFVCTFSADFGCDIAQGGGVVLTSGTWSMAKVPGTAGFVNFNDQASSFTCSPL
ncbi:hypothetical protein M413DRAFT_449467 [Hebeloma cylindrosporum]|uniref:Uncharacterized protein n=1 Tax=Hebeloma cylindrosporum TaxID=76867 RepID=A0A0C3BH14_HEBCY|nr:hypothetical protein M413DRAFT_449467 [Hebeloma cylindrosporum h7]